MGWQEDIPKKSEEFLKEFGIAFAKYYPLSMVIKAQNNAIQKASEGEDPRKLSYREWDSVEPDPSTLAKGVVYMRSGDGAASWGGWKECFLVQTPDNGIDVFDSEKDYAKPGAKPKSAIPFLGYTLITNCQEHFVEMARSEASELDISDPEISVSRYCWALDNSLRQRYMFQMHKGRNRACACFGGNAVEPEDAGAEFAEDSDSWIETFKFCEENVEGRDTEEDVISAAFERAKNSMIETIPELKDYDGDGTEGQILAEMIFLSVVEGGCKEEILTEVKKVPPMLRYTLWFKTRGIAMTLVGKVVEKGWDAIQNQAKGLNEKLEPKIMAGLQKIFDLKETLKNKALESAAGKLGELLEKHVSPHMKPVFDALDKPLAEGIRHAREVLEKKGGDANSISNSDARCRALDLVPRNPELTQEIKEACAEIGEVLVKLQENSGGVFEEMEPDTIQSSALELSLETLDAGVLTLQEPNTNMSAVLEKFDHDSVIQRATWMKNTINSILVSIFKQHIDPIMEPLIEPLTSAIPEDLRELFDIKSEFDSIAHGFVQQVVDKFVDGAYPLPEAKEATQSNCSPEEVTEET